MQLRFQIAIRALVLCIILSSGSLLLAQNPDVIQREQVLSAMRKASDYMANTVSCHGGYLWKYAEDFSEVEGEAPSRRSQVMVQIGTPEMGHLFLDLHECSPTRPILIMQKMEQITRSTDNTSWEDMALFYRF